MIPRLRLSAIILLALAPPAFAADTPAKQTIITDGRPAPRVRVALYNCDNGGLVAGPFTTAGDGSVTFPSVAPGNYCERTEVPAGFASVKVRVDPAVANQRVEFIEVVPPIDFADRTIAFIFCLATFFIVIFPIVRYLAKPWAFRREKLIGELQGNSMILYYKQFRSGECIPQLSAGKPKPDLLGVGDPNLTIEDYEHAFFQNFNKWYGRRYYVAPTLALAVLTVVCAWWGTINLHHWISGLTSLESMRGLTGAALAGAFVWIIADELDRLRRRDFTSSDVYYYVFRLLLAIPFAWALTRIQVSLTVGIPIAFFLGAFPTNTLFTGARRIVNQYTHLGDDPASGNLELEKLQAVGKESAERYKDEGISTISQLAYADPIDLTIRTNFDFNYVSDCVSQAILWLYLGDQMPSLAIFSLRGGYEANALMQALKSDDPTNANKSLANISAYLATQKVIIEPEALKTTLYQAAYDPYTLFLVDVWTDGPPSKTIPPRTSV